ncbi:MAG: TIGR02147 family protein [Bdellovibrionales bacterium]|nr:TIGR02147 family protein [Bdellovibrionales bacterium]
MSDQKISIFNFDNYLDFLKVVAQPKEAAESSKLTLEDWAKKLGYRSPSSLSMVLKGQRLPSQDMLQAISEDLQLNQFEVQYLELLVKLEKQKRRNKDITKTLEKIYALNTQKQNSFYVSHAHFSYISDWYHFAIKQLVSSPNFQEDADWISKRLRKKVSPAKVKEAIDNLIKLGVLYRDTNNKLASTGKGIEVPNADVASAALRNHHKGMIQRALESIDEQNINERYLNAITLQVDPEQQAQAKEFITQFLREFAKQFSANSSNQVNQLNVQFFQHTNKEDQEPEA